MKVPGWFGRRPRVMASVAAVTASAVAITTMAFLYDGTPTTELDLNDGSVWITKESKLLVGHFNNESVLLDGAVSAGSDNYDILQNADRIVVVDETASKVTAVDPALMSLTDSADIPGGSTVALGGATVAVLGGEGGSLWSLPAAGVGAFDPAATEPLAELGAESDVVVAEDGTVFAVSARDKVLVTVPADPDGAPKDPQYTDLPDLPDNAEVSVTAVGNVPVVFDAETGTVIAGNGLIVVLPEAIGGRLQQASAGADAVTIATETALIRVPWDGSDPLVLAAGAEGVPAEPVFLDGCAYGAWSGSGSFIRDCPGSANDLTTMIDGLDPEAELVFRVNRDVIILNDVRGGTAWMAAEDLQQVDNWDDLTPPEGDAEETDENTTEETTETTLPERTEQNTAPIAVDDDFGVRPGRTTVLPVLDNDTDADGDVLTVTLPDGSPSLGEVQSINNGTGLQIAVPDDADGTSRFTYLVDDGRGGTDTAVVSLTVRDDTVNAGPKQSRITTLLAEAGGVVTHNLLPDWIDPDGDDVYLQAVVPQDGDEVDFTPDGRITYRSINGVQGRKDIPIIVSDAEESTEGVLRLDVRPPGSLPPVTNADHVVTGIGEPVTVAPLANDLNTSQETLRLTRVDDVEGTTVTPDYAEETFTFTAGAAGVYYVQYLASAGAKSAPGIVRVDVRDTSNSTDPPVAVRDVALLPSAGEVLVAPLANDVDPAGGILVVQSITVEQDSGIAVAVLGHETLRIADQGSLSEQVTVNYTISNGLNSATGQVVVIPVPGPDKIRPPVANDDEVVVRAGDVVTIPVLDNDYHPNNDVIHVSPELVEEPETGEIFVSQDTVRFKAPTEPGTAYATYEVEDSTGQRDAGYITIQVLGVDPDTNQAPRPHDLTTRVLSGAQVRIPVPLDGIDADGDSVELVGVATAPEKGRVAEVGVSHLVYEAVGEATGTDTFTYRVRDRLGKESTATVKVGIAPAETNNQAPYAVKDSIAMRPNRSVAVPVLANDSDPEGDAITLVADGVVIADGSGLEAEAVGDRIEIASPAQEGETSLQYSIRDERGAQADAVVQVTIDQDVPLRRPIARDDRVLPQDIDGESIDLALLANDEDPDGTVSALAVELDDPDIRLLDDGVARITLTDTERLVTYTITDQDGLSASAFIRIPSLLSLPPTLISTKGVEVQSGETIELSLSEYVRASGGNPVVITEAAKVSAVNSNGESLVKDQSTLVYTSADGYHGPDAISFEVTDGTGPDDPEGRKATLALPITVLPPDNQQPTFVDGTVEVAAGEDPVSVDLASLTDDPDDGDIERMSYRLEGGAPVGLSARVEGSALLVSADSATAKGTQATLSLQISDGETDPISGSVVVTVTASNRPLPTANDDVVDEAPQGKTASVPVLDNDFNPFPDTPLKVVTAVTQTGEGTAVVSGDSVDITPSPTFVGTMTVRYRIQDATADRDREVEGLISVTVQGRPDRPGIPTVSSVQDRTVALSWTPPVDNGSPITEYVVSATGGGYSKTCASTTCTLDGLTNNVEYNFTVVAVNAIGESDPSLPSETARPDARPDTPQPPTLTFGNANLAVAWTTPTTPGSPVESFTLEISPAPPSGVVQKTGVTGNSLVWEGLENGTAYQVRVQAHNRAPEPSSWSAWSATEIPASPPDPVGAPATQRLSPVGNQAQLQVSWAQPSTGGAPISGYRLDVMQGGGVVRSVDVPGGVTSQAVVIPTSTTDYTFRVQAQNKAGWGQYGPASAPRRAFTAPDAPTGVTATPGDRSLGVNFNVPAGNGANPGEMQYQYSFDGTNWTGFDGGRINGLTNGERYAVRVRAVTSLDGATYEGPSSSPAAVQIPYGAVGAPSVTARATGRDITFTWSAPAPNGRPIDRMEIRIDNGGWEPVQRNGSRTGTYQYSTTHSIDVRAVDTEGQTSRVVSASARTVDRPTPTAKTGIGQRGNWPDECTTETCAYMTVTVKDFEPGTYTLSCNSEPGPYGGTWGTGTYTLPANGTVQLRCFFGDPGKRAWVSIQGWGNADEVRWR